MKKASLILGMGVFAIGFAGWGISLAQVSQTNFPAAGKWNAGDDQGFSARSSAMGGALAGVADDASALFSNPAGLAFLDRGQIMVNSQLELVDVLKETIVAGFPTEDWGGFGFAGTYVDYGALQGRDEAGTLAPNYGANRLGFRGGWGIKVLPNLSFGTGLAGSREALAEQSYSTLTGQFGLLLQISNTFRLGLTTNDLPIGVTLGPPVSTFNAGASYEMELDTNSRLLFALGGSLKTDSLSDLRVGVEGAFLSRYFLRAGYKASLDNNGLEDLSGLTLGAGVTLGDFKLDYAYFPYGSMGNVHHFDIGYFFGTSSPKDQLKGPGFSPGSANGAEVVSGAKQGNADQNKLNNQSLNTPAPKPQGLEKATQAETGAPEKDSLTVHFALAPDFLAKGEAMEAKGNYPEAIRLFREVLKQNSRNAQAWWDLGNVYSKLKQKADAIPCFENVLKLKPDTKGLREWLEKYKALSP